MSFDTDLLTKFRLALKNAEDDGYQYLELNPQLLNWLLINLVNDTSDESDHLLTFFDMKNCKLSLEAAKHICEYLTTNLE